MNVLLMFDRYCRDTGFVHEARDVNRAFVEHVAKAVSLQDKAQAFKDEALRQKSSCAYCETHLGRGVSRCTGCGAGFRYSEAW